MKNIILALVLCTFGGIAYAETAEEIEQYIGLLRSDLQTEKVQLITVNMQFSVEESASFWPVYNKYQTEWKKIGDKRMALIKDYAENYDAMTDAKAAELTGKALDLESQRIDLLKKYVPEFSKALTAKRVARLVQVENQINRLIDVQIAEGIPLAK